MRTDHRFSHHDRASMHSAARPPTRARARFAVSQIPLYEHPSLRPASGRDCRPAPRFSRLLLRRGPHPVRLHWRHHGHGEKRSHGSSTPVFPAARIIPTRGIDAVRRETRHDRGPVGPLIASATDGVLRGPNPGPRARARGIRLGIRRCHARSVPPQPPRPNARWPPVFRPKLEGNCAAAYHRS